MRFAATWGSPTRLGVAHHVIMAGVSVRVLMVEHTDDFLFADETPTILAGTSRKDVAARIDVRVQGRSAASAAEQVSRRPIASGRVPAVGALLAGVGRIDFSDGDAVKFLNAFQFRRNGVTTGSGEQTVHSAAEVRVAEVQFLHDDFLDLLPAEPVEQSADLVAAAGPDASLQVAVSFRFGRFDTVPLQAPGQFTSSRSRCFNHSNIRTPSSRPSDRASIRSMPQSRPNVSPCVRVSALGRVVISLPTGVAFQVEADGQMVGQCLVVEEQVLVQPAVRDDRHPYRPTGLQGGHDSPTFAFGVPRILHPGDLAVHVHDSAFRQVGHPVPLAQTLHQPSRHVMRLVVHALIPCVPQVDSI